MCIFGVEKSNEKTRRHAATKELLFTCFDLRIPCATVHFARSVAAVFILVDLVIRPMFVERWCIMFDIHSKEATQTTNKREEFTNKPYYSCSIQRNDKNNITTTTKNTQEDKTRNKKSCTWVTLQTDTQQNEWGTHGVNLHTCIRDGFKVFVISCEVKFNEW